MMSMTLVSGVAQSEKADPSPMEEKQSFGEQEDCHSEASLALRDPSNAPSCEHVKQKSREVSTSSAASQASPPMEEKQSFGGQEECRSGVSLALRDTSNALSCENMTQKSREVSTSSAASQASPPMEERHGTGAPMTSGETSHLTSEAGADQFHESASVNQGSQTQTSVGIDALLTRFSKYCSYVINIGPNIPSLVGDSDFLSDVCLLSTEDARTICQHVGEKTFSTIHVALCASLMRTLAKKTSTHYELSIRDFDESTRETLNLILRLEEHLGKMDAVSSKNERRKALARKKDKEVRLANGATK